MLLTDGLANHGVIDHDLLVAAAKRLRGVGIATSTFGVGADFDEDSALAAGRRGRRPFLLHRTAPADPGILRQRARRNPRGRRTDVAFEMTCDPGVEAMA